MDDRTLGYLNLALAKGVGPQTAFALINAFGSIDEVAKAPASALARVPKVSSNLASSIVRTRESDDAQREIDLASRFGGRIISMESDGYPESLRYIHDPPLVLYVKGEWTRDDLIAFAVVGSRRCSYYGRSRTEHLARALAARGITVVSGLAYGIDSIAHQASLKAGGRTIAVLGSGLGKLYPSGSKKLADDISKHGALLSEFPVMTGPEPTNFPRRNRLISGLALGVIVVEASRQSGALITANWALEQGKEVFAVPGEAGSHLSRGTNHLIRMGAKLVEEVEDILDEFPDISRSLPAAASAAPAQQEKALSASAAVSRDEHAVLSSLGAKPVNIENIIAAAGMPAQKVSSTLMMLELKGLARQLPGKMFVRRE